MPSLQEQIIYRVQDARDVLEEKDKSLKQYIEYIVANQFPIYNIEFIEKLNYI